MSDASDGHMPVPAGSFVRNDVHIITRREMAVIFPVGVASGFMLSVLEYGFDWGSVAVTVVTAAAILVLRRATELWAIPREVAVLPGGLALRMWPARDVRIAWRDIVSLTFIPLEVPLTPGIKRHYNCRLGVIDVPKGGGGKTRSYTATREICAEARESCMRATGSAPLNLWLPIRWGG